MADRVVLPFIHLVSKSEESAELKTCTDVGEHVENEKRVVFQFNVATDLNPSAELDVVAVMEHYFFQYCYNSLNSLVESLNQRQGDLYVTHSLKNLPTITQVDQLTYQVVTEHLHEYLEDTVQTEERFSLALLVDTLSSLHTQYTECTVGESDEWYTTIHVDPEFTPEWSMLSYEWQLYAHYPIKLVPAAIKFAVTGKEDSLYKVRFTGMADIHANKRAII